MGSISIVGTCTIGTIACDIKLADHGDYVIIFLTEKGHDVPISGSQARIQKDINCSGI